MHFVPEPFTGFLILLFCGTTLVTSITHPALLLSQASARHLSPRLVLCPAVSSNLESRPSSAHGLTRHVYHLNVVATAIMFVINARKSSRYSCIDNQHFPEANEISLYLHVSMSGSSYSIYPIFKYRGNALSRAIILIFPLALYCVPHPPAPPYTLQYCLSGLIVSWF